MVIRRIRQDEGTPLRAFRLRALADAPDAFGTTLAEAGQRPLADWDDRARRDAVSETSTILLAVEGDCWCGMVGAVVVPASPDTAELISMWVDPAYRRRGTALALTDAVVQWARAVGVAHVRLSVTETNVPARSLYVRAGFAATGHTEQHPSNPALREEAMARDLRTDVPPANSN